MPEFLEKKLKKQYGAKSKVPYKIMNSIGAMRGNKVTKKGVEMEDKHDAKNESQHKMHLRGLGGVEMRHLNKTKKKKKRSFTDALLD